MGLFFIGLVGGFIATSLGVWIARRDPVQSRATCVCGEPLFMCDSCAIKHRFRYVQTPPDVIRWGSDGPHQENDCGSVCVKYVRASE